ncbi:hypothetical protein JOF56_000252 [Kibdelosporangium banguiense]|uniref:Uncharacterized protein n=1 Tax=Kibdelosporangium banguiense TaxID=1365924 RepID=A0ABS4T5X0_9PSEU|nr:hypothetical protein [Kibdelosporangium banguiense]MBP2319867.1 hypothetical protein [Kibdelosporangium banguiense]
MDDSAYRRDCAALRTVWENAVAGEDGPLPGSALDPLVTPQGWCGHVQLAADQRAGMVVEAVPKITEAYGLAADSIVVRTMADETTVFIWAYSTRSGADYHLKWPHPVLDGSEFVDIKRESAGTTLLDLVQLTTWARAYKESWVALRSGRELDVQQFVRRLGRLRAGILDILARTKPRQVRELLLRVDIDHESLPADLASIIDYPRDRDPTIPIPR